MPDDPATPTDPTEPVVEPTTPAPSSGTPASLEAALVALDAERERVNEARKEAGDRRKRERELERELETLRTQGLSESEKAIADAKRSGAAERDAEWTARYLREAVTAAAGGKLRDPDDAYGLLEANGALVELRELEPDRMREAARTHVDKLLESKPYLAVAAGETDGGRSFGALTAGVRGRLEGGGGAGDESDWLRKAARRRGAGGSTR